MRVVRAQEMVFGESRDLLFDLLRAPKQGDAIIYSGSLQKRLQDFVNKHLKNP